jgi:hypothetical protein
VVVDVAGSRLMGADDFPKTPWPRAVAFYWAWVWRTLVFVLVPVALCGVVRLALTPSPLFEGVVLVAILGIGITACGVALRWAATTTFRGWTLRISSSSATSPVTLGRAFRLFWAYTWRHFVVMAPIGLAASWLGVKLDTASTGWISAVVAACISVPSSLMSGTWAIREALHRPFKGHRFLWFPVTTDR